jgi:hypothetical protein
MSVWRRGPVTTNPYHRTAFAVARVPREVVRHKTVVALLGQARQVVRADPQAHVLPGGPVSEPEINAAERVLLDAPRRLAEELLVHAAEAPPLEAVRRLLAEVTEALAGDDEPAPGGREGLRCLLGPLVVEFLAAAPPSEPSFGALETESIPPFGGPEEE